MADVLPMHLSLSTPPANRLCQLLVLLLLALGLLAGMSVSQSRAVEAQTVHTQVVVVPALQWVHALATRVDEQRGMAALHITLRSDAERQALEARLQASRQQLERRMAAFGQRLAGETNQRLASDTHQRLADDTNRRHHATVQAGLASFWDAQDRLLAASRRAASDPAAAPLARALLVGEAQQAFERVRADIEAWWAEAEREAGLAASEAGAAAQHAGMVVWAQALLAALSLAVAWALLRTSEARPPPRLAAPSPTRSPGAQALDGGAAQPHLQALNDAVALARRGEPGRAAGLSALEARHLAEQVDSAARALRRLIDRPGSAPPAAPSDPQTDTAPAHRPDGPAQPR